MKNFKDFAEFDAFVKNVASKEKVFTTVLLKAAATIVEIDAKQKFGVYQDSDGRFPEWQRLAPSTNEDRVRKGYKPDEPLLREGTLRDSIRQKIEGNKAVVGSDSDIMVYQELGTKNIPARPVLGPALFQNKKNIQKLASKALFNWIVNNKKIVEHEPNE